MPPETLIATAAGPVRAQFLRDGVLRITHGIPGAADMPLDRPWLREVLLPQADDETGPPNLTLAAQAGNVVVRGPEGQVVVAEARPARVNQPWRKPSLVVDI